MKDTLAILWIETQILIYKSLTFLANSYSAILDQIPRFMYLYLMDEYKKTDYRNVVASRIRELKSKNDPNMELAIERVSKLYKWMCDNQ